MEISQNSQYFLGASQLLEERRWCKYRDRPRPDWKVRHWNELRASDGAWHGLVMDENVQAGPPFAFFSVRPESVGGYLSDSWSDNAENVAFEEREGVVEAKGSLILVFASAP